MQQTPMALLIIISASLLGGAASAGLRSQTVKAHAPAGHFDGALSPSDAKESLLEVGGFSMSSNSTELPSIASLESTLADLEADRKAGKVTPGMGNFVETVTKMIHREMIPAIMKQDKIARRVLRNFVIGFRRCANIRSRSRGRIASMKKTSRSTSFWHGRCRKGERVRYIRKKTCLAIVHEKRKAMRAACNAFRALIRNPKSEANVCHTSNAAEPYGLWLKRNKKDFKSKLTGYRLARNRCNFARRTYYRVLRPCVVKVRYWWRTRRSCVRRQYRLETSTCTWAKKIKDTCNSYSSCYDAQLALYKKQVPKLKVQEKDRKGEFRALKRIECLLASVFAKSDTVDTKKIDGCKAKTHSTKHLDLKYPPIPNKMDCQKVPAIPRSSIFTKVQYRTKYGNLWKLRTPPARSLECVMSPGGGVIMGLAKYARKDKCRMENGWLVAQNGGSCMLAVSDGYPVKVNYRKRRYTKYRFTMKMDEVNTRDGQSGGGGFSICNLVGWSSFANGKDPTIAFTDSKAPSRWGYHLQGGFKGIYRRRQPVKCKQLMAKYKVWGKDAMGIDVSKYTKGRMKWIGAYGSQSKGFFCTDSGDGIVFGAKTNLRALLPKGKKVPTKLSGCCSRKNPDGVCNAMAFTRDINYLCRQLGYTRGTILSARKDNYCPRVSVRRGGKWGSSFVRTNRYGNKFRCQGATSKSLYTNKNYYKQAEPKAGSEKKWDVTMEYRGGKYMLRSLKIEGKDFSGYRGSQTVCPPYNRRNAFAPRITSARTGKVYIKDFRVFQGNSLRRKKSMRQVVGQGVGRGRASKKKLIRAAKRAARKIPRCTRLGSRGNRWYNYYMWIYRNGYIKKNPRARRHLKRSWRTYASLPNVVSAKFRIVQRQFQHNRIGLTSYRGRRVNFRGGVGFAIYPRGRLYVRGWGSRWIRRRWRYGDSLIMRIIGRRYCTYQNNRRIACWRAKRNYNRPANLQVFSYEGRKRGIQLLSVCNVRR